MSVVQLPNIRVLGPTRVDPGSGHPGLVLDARAGRARAGPVHAGPARSDALPEHPWRGSPKERGLLAMLTLHLRSVVSVDQLVDALWGTKPPRTVGVTLQGYVAQARRALEPSRAPRATPQVLRTVGNGYVLHLPDDHADAGVFAHRVAAGLTDWHTFLEPPWPRVRAVDADSARAMVDTLHAGLGLWRGIPFQDLGDYTEVASERARLEELRTAASELAASLRMGLGDHAAVVPELEQLALRNPLRESVAAHLALALARSSRQSEALDVLRVLGGTLRRELGLDLSPMAEDLRTAILRQDPAFGLGRGPQERAAVAVRQPEFIGRVPERARIELSLVAASGGHGRAVLVTGQMGSGKSRLAQEMADVALGHGMKVIDVAVPEAFITPELWPIRQIVDQCASRLGAPAPDIDPASGGGTRLPTSGSTTSGK